MITKRQIKKVKPKTLIREARYLLRKKGAKLDEDTRKEVENSISCLDAKSNMDDQDSIFQEKENLYNLLGKHMPRTVSDVLKDIFRALITAVIIALLFRQFVIEPFEIPTGSMIPTLKVYDKILVSKFTYGLNIPFLNVKLFDFNKPDRWEVVVFTY